MQSKTYEELRAANCERNRALFDALGLANSAANKPAATPRHASKRTAAKSAVPRSGTRASKRLRDGPAESPTLSGAAVEFLDSATGTADWARALLEEPVAGAERRPRKRQRSSAAGALAPSRSSSQLRWDRSKMHQHLTLSDSGRTVVTTGCAGYGGVLAKWEGSGAAEVRVAAKKKSAKGVKCDVEYAWGLEVLAEGVGGFAFGLAAANTSKPYKSLGNRPDAWVWHSSGFMLHNRKTKKVAGEYGVGDAVGVHLSSAGHLRFSLNGKLLDSGVVLPEGKYTLCCQPYMGGGARL